MSSRIACIWGGNGISGMAMIEHLIGQSTREWKRIICISRRMNQLTIEDDRIDFISLDLLNSSIDDIIDQLKTVNGDRITDVFHYTYIEKSNEEELDRVNKIILEKALEACATVAGQTIQSFSLQTGYKVSLFDF